MPGFIAHHLFGIKILSKSPNNYLKSIIQTNLNSFKLGLQGPDIFFYYLPALRKTGVNNIGSYMHSNKSNLFFDNYIKALDSLEMKEKKIAISYLSGFLCHYYLDTTCHPYIYYKSGFLTRYRKPSKEYYASHRTLETDIDTLLLQKYLHKKNSEFHKDRIAKLSKTESDIISCILSTSIELTFEVHTISPILIKKILHLMKYECILLSDKSGIKRKSMIFLEKRLTHYNILSSIIPSDNFKDNYDVLNSSHCNWYSPWNTATIYDSSFLDLFQISMKYCSDTLIQLNNYLLSIISPIINSAEIRRTLLLLIGNKSYHTGLNCNLYNT